VEHFRLALAGNPEYKEALLGLGQASLMEHQPQAAVGPLRKATELDPNYAQAHFLLGAALRKLGRWAEADREQALSAKIQEQQQAEYTRKLGAH
jgi:Flp pilus assembly protein TadD